MLYSQFVVLCSLTLFSMRYAIFSILYDLFAIRCPLFSILYSLFAVL